MLKPQAGLDQFQLDHAQSAVVEAEKVDPGISRRDRGRAKRCAGDLIRLDNGALGVIELELIEPSLWLQHAPDQGASFAAAIAARAR